MSSKIGRLWGQAGAVVPCDLLAEVIVAHKAELEYEDRHAEAHEGQDSGWRINLAERVSAKGERKTEAVFRRLYDVLHGKTVTLNVGMAEDMLIAVGLMLDHDTDLPTLPGCIAAAREMADIHTEGERWTLGEKEKLAQSLFHFSQGFVHHDEPERAAEVVCRFIHFFGNAPIVEGVAVERELVAA